MELVYEFVFNPDFSMKQKHSSLSTNLNNQATIIYILFLQKYLIIQFEQYYQLYNIGESLISIQIAVNNFNFIPQEQSLPHFYNQKNSSQRLRQLSNVIINDAFLVQGDSILIYEKNSLVVTKYITNPKLSYGSFNIDHSLVQKNFSVQITPVDSVTAE